MQGRWLLILLICLPINGGWAAWFDNTWTYRVPINVPTGAAVNATIKADVDFNALLTSLGVSGTLDVNSPRIVRPNDALVTTQEFTDTVYLGATDATGNGRGEIRFLLQDAGPSTYYLYFDITANGSKAGNPQTPLNGNFEKGATGAMSPAGWTGSVSNAIFDAQVRPSETPNVTANGGSPSPTTTDGTPNTGSFSYLLGARSNNDSSNGSASVQRTIVVPSTNPGNLVMRYRLEGWDSSDDGANLYDFLTVTLKTTQLIGPASSLASYTTLPFSPNKGTSAINATSSGYGYYNYWDMDNRGRHRSGMTSVNAGDEPWWTGTFNLAAYAGQTVTLSLQYTLYNQYKSWVHVDDVEWSVNTATLGVPERRTLVDHLRIEHDGQGLTCAPESITIKACVDANCTSLYTGSVTANLTSPTTGWASNPITFSAGSVTTNLSVTTASTVNPAATATAPVATNTTRCFINGVESTTSCPLVISACANSFTCLESGTLTTAGSNLLNGRLYTKLAGTAFSFDVAALKSDGTVETGYVSSGGAARAVTVELVDASSGAACAALPALSPAVSQSLSFTSASLGRKTAASMTVNPAYPNVRCRVTDATVSPSKVSCSTDAFAIRPVSFSSVTTTVATADTTNGSSTTNTPRLKAGTTAFDLTATAINGYNGTPKIDNSQIGAHTGAVTTGAVTGSFGAASSANGQASGSSFLYSEVGYFRFIPTGVYDDGFTSVDAGTGDCSSDFSNTQVSGKYGCKFGNTANTGWFGRFVPDHFTLAAGAAVAPACTAGGFTYMDQPALGVSYTVRAENAANAVTQNYTGAFAKATIGVVAENSDAGVDLGSRLSGITGTWSSGLQAVSTTTAMFSRAASPDGPFDTLVLGARLADNDGSTTVLNGLDLNATTTGSCTVAGNCTAKALNPTGTKMRHGRLVLDPALGSELLPLALTLRAEYFNGTAWAPHMLDVCTTYTTANDATKGAYNLVCTDPLPADGLSCASLAASGSGTLAAGLGSGMTLSAPGVPGILNYGLTTQAWLKPNPSTSVSFGIYRGNDRLIYQREVWN